MCQKNTKKLQQAGRLNSPKTSPQNRCAHGILRDFAQIRIAKIDLGDKMIYFKPYMLGLYGLKFLFKYADLNYPLNDKNEPKSYAELSKDELKQHLEFIESEYYLNKG